MKCHFPYKTMSKLRLIPVTPEEVEACVSNFRNLTDDICINIPDVLPAMMNILHKKHVQAR